MSRPNYVGSSIHALLRSAATKKGAIVLMCLFFGCSLHPVEGSNVGRNTSKRLDGHSVGNGVSAVDIYGLGVRIGFYLQSAGITVSAIRPFRHWLRERLFGWVADERDEPHSDTPLIAFSIVLVAVLISLTTQISSHNISPAEVIVVLSIINTNTIVNFALLGSGFGELRGNGIGYFLNFACSVWLLVLQMWFWTKGRKTLPLLGTPSRTWFFAEVRIDGWYWIFSTAWVATTMLLQLPTLLMGLIHIGRAIVWWCGHDAELGLWYRQNARLRAFFTLLTALSSAVILPLFIATVEKTIDYNGLQPETDLNSPAQLIPFAAGIANSVDSILWLTRPWKRRAEPVEDDEGAREGGAREEEVREQAVREDAAIEDPAQAERGEPAARPAHIRSVSFPQFRPPPQPRTTATDPASEPSALDQDAMELRRFRTAPTGTGGAASKKGETGWSA